MSSTHLARSNLQIPQTENSLPYRIMAERKDVETKNFLESLQTKDKQSWQENEKTF